MAKFRIRLKLQALELEIDGEREDIPALTSAIRQQFGGLVMPAEEVADGHKNLGAGGTVIEIEPDKPKAKGKKKNSGRSAGDTVSAQPLDLRHDAATYGNPQQIWSNTDKCVWLLYVLQEMDIAKEVSGPQIAATFNHHFKATGALHPPHVTRELGKAKVKNPAWVGEDKKLDPSTWYLTAEGTKYAQQLVQGTLNPA